MRLLSSISQVLFLPLTLILLGFSHKALASRISIENYSHHENEAISMSFIDTTAIAANWIGIYWEEEDGTVDTSADPLLWLWTCGHQGTCDGMIESGVVTFSKHNSDHLLKWPLVAGNYVAILAHDYAVKRTVFAMTESFVVTATSPPSLAPSSNPSAPILPYSISVQDECHVVSNAISITFENNNADVGDWIGIFWDDIVQYTDEIGDEPLMWVWTCGSQTCNSIVERDTVVFGGNQRVDYLFQWPLMPGRFVAVLARGMHALAVSEPFRIEGVC